MLYLLSCPLLLLMLVVGALKAAAPDQLVAPDALENPVCPVEPGLPWMLVLGGAGVGVLLLLRFCVGRCSRSIKENQTCCDSLTGCFCEFGLTLLYDLVMLVLLVLWMVPVTWWVFRHWVGPSGLYSVLGEEQLDSFRAALGDRDTIHTVQFSLESQPDYCDRLLYTVAVATLAGAWLLLVGALAVFLADKIISKLLCRRLCRKQYSSRDNLDESSESFSHGGGEVQLRAHAAMRA